MKRYDILCQRLAQEQLYTSRWLGHKDGGALAMKTYGHLRREHSIAQAQKVSFLPPVAA